MSAFDKKQKQLSPNQERLVFVYQADRGWGKGKTIAEAIANHKKFNRGTHKLGIVSIFLLLNDVVTKEDAMKEIQLSDFNITYSTDNIILLCESVVKGSKKILKTLNN